jgi:hypothetical protein
LEKDPEVAQWTVSKKMDYEGLAVTGTTVYMLASSGAIVYFPQSFPVKATETVPPPTTGRNEFEILFHDAAAGRLLTICKACREDKKGKVSVFALSLADHRFAAAPAATISTAAIEAKLGRKIGHFKPSAANVHPLTGEFYIISSVNKLLVITDREFVVKDVISLNPQLYKQPEGLCFTPDGDLLISNEAAGRGSANILRFRQR